MDKKTRKELKEVIVSLVDNAEVILVILEDEDEEHATEVVGEAVEVIKAEAQDL